LNCNTSDRNVGLYLLLKSFYLIGSLLEGNDIVLINVFKKCLQTYWLEEK
jgi:hypothetical protein